MAPRATTLQISRILTVIIGILAAAVIVPPFGCKRPPPPAADTGSDDVKAGLVLVELAVATRAPMEATVVAQGVVVPGQGSVTHVAPAAAGRLVSVLVKEGDQVDAGRTIAIVDNRPQQAVVAGAEAAVGVSDALAHEAELAHRAAAADQSSAVRVARLALQTALLDKDGAVRAAQNQLQAAESDLTKANNGPRPQEVAQADEAVTQASLTRSRAHSELERNRRLLDAGIVSQRQFEDAQTASEVADSAFASAKSQASLMHSGSRPEDLLAAKIRVDGAKETLKLARSDGDAHVAQAQAVLLQAEQETLAVQAKEQDAAALKAGARQKRSDLAAAVASARYAEVRAPISGTVTKRFLNGGDMADATSPIVEISDTNRLNLLANLPPSDGGRLRAGMSARITSRDAPNSTMRGTLLSIGQVDPATNLLTVRVRVDHSASTLHVGSYALATIVLNTDLNAIVVPSAAVLTRDGKNTVYVVGSDNIAHEKAVEVGPERNHMIAVTKGISAGDHVVVLGNYELSDGAAVKTAEKSEAGANDPDESSDKNKAEPETKHGSEPAPGSQNQPDEKKSTK